MYLKLRELKKGIDYTSDGRGAKPTRALWISLWLWPRDMWDLSSLTRDQTCTPWLLEGRVLTTRPSGKSPTGTLCKAAQRLERVGGLACYSPWGREESDNLVTEQQQEARSTQAEETRRRWRSWILGPGPLGRNRNDGGPTCPAGPTQASATVGAAVWGTNALASPACPTASSQCLPWAGPSWKPASFLEKQLEGVTPHHHRTAEQESWRSASNLNSLL